MSASSSRLDRLAAAVKAQDVTLLTVEDMQQLLSELGSLYVKVHRLERDLGVVGRLAATLHEKNQLLEQQITKSPE